MKKGILFAIAVVLLCTFTNVNAMTESELKAKLTKTYVINGATFKANESQVAQIERYLAQNEISATDADIIASKIDEAVNVIKASGATSIDGLSRTSKDQLISIANDISNTTAVKLSISKGVLSVYNTDGSLFTKVEKNVVKQTNSNNIIVLSSLVSLIGIAFVSKKFF